MTTPHSSPADENNRDSIALGPDLPMAVFTSGKRWNPDRIGALALYCSDGRWGEAFDEFCQRHLQIPRYDRWAVPGGPAWLAPSNEEAGFVQTAREQLNFLVQVHQLERIVVITHYGCAYYGRRLGQAPEECLAAQIEDAHLALATLRGWYPEMAVEAYLAMRSESSLSFHGLQA
jgi:carbonic anhydrase-like protein